MGGAKMDTPEPTTELIAKAQQLADAATPGPWTWDGGRVPILEGRAGDPDYTWTVDVLSAEHNGQCACRSLCELELTVKAADAEFIAWCRQGVPLLVEKLVGARESIEKLGIAAQHPHKGPIDTDASMLREAAKRVEGGYIAGGSNTSAMVGRVLRVVADAIESRPA